MSKPQKQPGPNPLLGSKMPLPALWALFALAALVPRPADAGEAESKEPVATEEPRVAEIADDTADFPEIVVTATRILNEIEDLGSGMDVVKPGETLVPQAGLGELLSTLPGVDVQGGGFFGEKPTLNIRGLQGQYGTQRTLVLADGIPLNDGYLGDADLRYLGMEMIDRVEVVRGPCSALYGKSALGGVVNIISRRGQVEPETEMSILAGQYDTFGATLLHGWRVGEFDYLVSAETLTTDGYLDNPDGSARDWEASSFGTRLGYTFGNGSEVGLFAQVTSGKGEREDFVEDTDRGIFWLSYRAEPSGRPGSVFTARAYRTMIDQELAWKFGFDATYDLVKNGVQLQQELRLGERHRLVFGGELIGDDVDVSEAAGPVRADSTGGAGYVQDQIKLTDDWRLTAGARFDYEEQFGGEVSPRVGVVRKLGGGDKLYASVGKGYRAPSASDLYLPTTVYMGMTFEGNPDLDPERHWAVEVGGSHRAGKGSSVSWATFYDLGLDAWDFMQDPDTIYRPHNVTEQHTFGVELGAKAELGRGFSLAANYTFVHATYNEYEPDPAIEGNLVEDVPEHSGAVALAHRSARDMETEFLLRFAGPRFTDADNSEPGKLDGFAVLDLKFSAPLGPKLKAALTVKNVFDEDYAVSTWQMPAQPFPQPGRSFYFSMRAKF